MEPFDATLASLTYLTNPLYQQIIKQKKEIKASSNKSDIKFYRKRISSLTKDMLKGEIPDNDYIKHVYEAYVNGLIKYFKMLDTSDIIQKQYDDADIIDSSIDANPDIIDSVIDANSMDDIPLVKEVTVDEILMRKYPSVATLDNFVIKQHNESKDTRIIPVILDIDLKEPSLKKKGIKKNTEKKSHKKKSRTVTELETISELSSEEEKVDEVEYII
jgi:hypothetical protein